MLAWCQQQFLLALAKRQMVIQKPSHHISYLIITGAKFENLLKGCQGF